MLPVIVQIIPIHCPATSQQHFRKEILAKRMHFFFSLARYFHISNAREQFEKQKSASEICLSLHFCGDLGEKSILIKNEGIMILASAPFLPARVCEVFISVIVIHPSSVHSELITAYEK